MRRALTALVLLITALGLPSSALAQEGETYIDQWEVITGIGVQRPAVQETPGFILGDEILELGLQLAPAARVPGAEDEGVVVTKVTPGSDAAKKGLLSGDMILDVGGQKVATPTDLIGVMRKALEKAGPMDRVEVVMRVRKGTFRYSEYRAGEEQRFVILPLSKAMALVLITDKPTDWQAPSKKGAT